MQVTYDDMELRRMRRIDRPVAFDFDERRTTLETEARAEAVGEMWQGIFRFFRRLGDGIGHWRQRHATQRELAQLDDRTLSDIGMARADIPTATSMDLVDAPRVDAPIVPKPDEHEGEQFAREQEEQRRRFEEARRLAMSAI